jgi:hypothetical protein
MAAGFFIAGSTIDPLNGLVILSTRQSQFLRKDGNNTSRSSVRTIHSKPCSGNLFAAQQHSGTDAGARFKTVGFQFGGEHVCAPT